MGTLYWLIIIVFHIVKKPDWDELKTSDLFVSVARFFIFLGWDSNFREKSIFLIRKTIDGFKLGMRQIHHWRAKNLLIFDLLLQPAIDLYWESSSLYMYK